jgi:hypothetical protein
MRYKWKTVSPPTNQTLIKEYTMSTIDAGDRAKAFHTVRCSVSINILIYRAHIAKTYTHNKVVEDTNMKKNR